MALAYFITFTTYGTWLHGTSKGKGSVDRQHNQYGQRFVAPDAGREIQSCQNMLQAPYIMRSAGERGAVRDAIVGLCRRRSWRLFALHVRTNQVHAVITAPGDPGRVMSDMKAGASRELTRGGFDDAKRRRWTRHGSTLHLFNQVALEDKIDYTLNRQGAMLAYYDGREQ